LSPERDAASLRSRFRRALAVALVLTAACGDDPVDPDPACADVPALALGQTAEGALEPGDAVLDGSYIDYYGVLAPADGTLAVEMASEIPADTTDPGLDPFLYLWADSLGDPVRQGYDPTGEGPLLRVAVMVGPVDPGCYRIGASGWPSAARGAYTLRADFTPAP
jgi:hypothetical protein